MQTTYCINNSWSMKFTLITILFLILAFLGGGVLVLLVLGHEVVHVRLGLRELHLAIPSPVYQCKKALRRNIAVNCSETRLNISWMAVELPMKVELILRPLGGISHTDDLMLLGIHSPM